MTLDPTHGDWIRVLRVNAMCLDHRANRPLDPGAPFSLYVEDEDMADAARVANELADAMEQRDREQTEFLAEVK